MKENISLEIQREGFRLKNLFDEAEKVKEKSRRLQKHLEQIEQGIANSAKRIETLGQKSTTSKDPLRPLQADEVRKRETSNFELAKQKLELLQRYFPEDYEKFEKCLPTLLKKETIGF